MSGRTRILFLTLTNDVGSDRIVSDMGRHGALCAVLGPRDSFASLARCVTGRFEIAKRFGTSAATFTLRRRLAVAVAAWHPDRIVPLDELAALLLRSIAAHAKTPAAMRSIIIDSLGSPKGYAATFYRLPLMRAAAQVGVRTPAFCGATDSAAVEAISLALNFPMMVKRDHSSGSAGVVRVETAPELTKALRRAWLKTAAKRLMARVAGYGRNVAPILLQEQVPGRLAMHTVACRNGIVIDGASFVAIEMHPEKRASTILRSIDNAEMAQAARKLVESLKCSGFVSFDFVINDAGEAFLIEMNARPIGSTHLGRLFGHDLTSAFLTGRRSPEDAPLLAPTNAIALFPKELERDPTSPYLQPGRKILHDVPGNEPAVLTAYAAHLQVTHPTRMAEIRVHFRHQGLEPGSRAEPLLGRTKLC